MQHLNGIERIKTARKSSWTTTAIAGLFFGAAGCLLWVALSGKVRPAANPAMAKWMSKSQRSVASIAPGETRYVAKPQKYYRVRLWTDQFNTMMPDHKFPVMAGLVIDGKPQFVSKGAHYFDKYLKLTKGKHLVQVVLWDAHKKVRIKNYLFALNEKTNSRYAKK